MADDTTRTPGTTGAEDVAVSIAGRISILVSGIAIQSLLAYALLPVGRGAYAVCLMFAGLLSLLFTPGADAGVQYFVMTRKTSISQGVSVAVVICLTGAGLATAAAIPLIRSEIAFFGNADPASFYLALILVPLTAFASAVHHQLAGLGRFAALAAFTLVQTAANGVAAAALVLGARLGVNGALLAVCIGDLVIILLCLRDMRRNFGLTWEPPSRLALGDVLRYGLKYHPARIGGNVDTRVGVLLLGMLAVRAEVGLFAVASGLMMRFIMISHAVASPLLPRSARGEGGRPDLVAFCARVTTWVTAAALVVFLAFSVPLVRILFSTEFLPIVPLIWIIAPGILFFSGANVLTSYFRVTNRPEVCSWAAAIGLTVNLATIPLLYPAIGLEAAAWGLSGGLCARSVVLSVAYHRATRTRPTRNWLLQRGDIARIVSSAHAAMGRITGRSSVDV